MLELSDVHTFYGESHILKGVSFNIKKGEVVTLLGRNGMGKSTTVKTIMGILHPRSGTIRFKGKNIVGLTPHEIARLGIGYVPEERRIFPSLSVIENLTFAVWGIGQEGWSIEKIFHFFPRLKERTNNKGSQLSGGEQQMLAIARIIRAKIDLIILDEPTEGLAPIIVKNIKEILEEMKKEGTTILLIEQNIKFAEMLADKHNILYDGKVVYTGENEKFQKDFRAQKKYLGI